MMICAGNLHLFRFVNLGDYLIQSTTIDSIFAKTGSVVKRRTRPSVTIHVVPQVTFHNIVDLHS